MLVGLNPLSNAGTSWRSELSDLQDFVPRDEDLVLNAVLGSSSCPGTSYFDGLASAAEETGGSVSKVCGGTAVDTLIDSLQDSSLRQSSFPLANPALAQSITVWVDDIERSSGWSYDSATQALVFEDLQVPDGGSTVTIEYAQVPDCPQL